MILLCVFVVVCCLFVDSLMFDVCRSVIIAYCRLVVVVFLVVRCLVFVCCGVFACAFVC